MGSSRAQITQERSPAQALHPQHTHSVISLLVVSPLGGRGGGGLGENTAADSKAWEAVRPVHTAGSLEGSLS